MEPPFVRVRIAPSPTGPLHIGTARTALINVLFARQHRGRCVLRIEDTDRARSTPEHERAILDDLQWLGIAWDEGPDVGGAYAPYRQSERTAHYRNAVAQLLRAGRAYRCFCSEDLLARAREEATARRAPFRYPGTCREISPRDGAARAGRGEPFVVRLRMDHPGAVTVRDLVRGDVRFSADAFDDFIISKGTDEPTFHLAVVVDDAAMEITHVIRGEDHLSNTPKHIALCQALGVPTPHYAHLPLILDEKKRKLSKRTSAEATTVAAYREQGFLPATLINALALLGWNPKTDAEVFTFDELTERFRLEHVQKGGATLSFDKLRWLNRQHLARLAPEEILAAARPVLARDRRLADVPRAALARAAEVERERIAQLTELPEALAVLGVGENAPALAAATIPRAGGTAREAREALRVMRAALAALPDRSWNDRAALRDAMLSAADASRLGRGTLLWPVRYALSGREKSPPPQDLSWILGKDETLRRLARAERLLEGRTG